MAWRTPTRRLVRVVAPHFVAGLVVNEWRCVEAAPILAWCRFRRIEVLREEFQRRGWSARYVAPSPSGVR